MRYGRNDIAGLLPTGYLSAISELMVYNGQWSMKYIYAIGSLGECRRVNVHHGGITRNVSMNLISIT
jgi:hypothetical protein